MAILIALLPVTVGIVTGCRTPSQQRKTFNTMWSLATAVDTSYKSYLDLVIAGKVPTNSVPRVSQAYANFQTDFNTALVLVSFNTNAAPTTGLLQSSQVFTVEVTNAKQGF